MRALNRAGFTLKNELAMYQALIESSSNAIQLAEAFIALKELDASLEDHRDLYKKVTNRASSGDEIAQGLRALNRAGFTLKEASDLYQALINSSSNARKLAEAFIALKELDASLEDHRDLYQEVIKEAFSGDKIAQGLSVLNSAGIVLKEAPYLYQALIKSLGDAIQVAKAFIALKNAGASSIVNLELYRLLIRKASDSSFIDDVVSCLDLLVSQKVSVASSPHMNAIHIALESPETLNFLLKGLENLGFSFATHRSIYDFFLKEREIYSRYLCSKMILELKSYLSSHSREGEIPIELLQEVIDKETRLIQGPLNKSKETMMLEGILRKLSVFGPDDFDKVTIEYSEKVGYILSYPGHSIYLNLLLKNVNFNHIELTNEEVEALGIKYRCCLLILAKLLQRILFY